MTLETRLVQAHVLLKVTPRDGRGSKFASLARYGAYEVRLVEASPLFSSTDFAFRLELFDHRLKAPIETNGTEDLEDAVSIAEELVGRAAQLSSGIVAHNKPSLLSLIDQTTAAQDLRYRRRSVPLYD